MIKKLPHRYVRQFLFALILRFGTSRFIRFVALYHLQINREND